MFEIISNSSKTALVSVKSFKNDSFLQLDGGVVKLSMEELKRAYPNIRTLVGNSVYVKASVLTKTGKDFMFEGTQEKQQEVNPVTISDYYSCAQRVQEAVTSYQTTRDEYR